ncbi:MULTISPECIES: fibronectin type III domain-containing protein [unclassified Microbacterium]|uniref:fibronectin type III domain-containing protein n=1 Tax=unclassified Microbacterium TaxID=2609290 RepID=UPI00342507C7
MTIISSKKSTALGAVGAIVLLSALGSAGNAVAQEPATRLVSASATDAQAPSDVTALQARATSASTINLSWAAAVDDVAVARYEVRSPSTTVLATVDGSTTQATLANLKPGAWYSLQVWAYDAAGNTSGSNVVDLRMPSSDAALLLPDVTAPSTVKSLAAPKARVGSTSAYLLWSKSVDDLGVVEYRVRDRISGTTVAAVPGTIGITGLKGVSVALTPATTYELEVVAVDAAGNVSAPSKPVAVVTKPAA